MSAVTSVGSSSPRKARSAGYTLATNSAANVSRLTITSLVSIFLPAYLTHRLPVEKYSAWVLILQLSAYVSYLDLGVQTAIAKYVAQYQAQRDYAACKRCTSAGLIIMIAAGAAGVLLTIALSWRIPTLFHAMPGSILHDVRLSVLLVGISLSCSLVTSVFVAIFQGLQRYQAPMLITIVSRLLFAAVMCLAVAYNSGLVVMSVAAASVNILTAVLQVGAWQKFARHIQVSVRSADLAMLRQMGRYYAPCSPCGLCVCCLWAVSTLL